MTNKTIKKIEQTAIECGAELLGTNIRGIKNYIVTAAELQAFFAARCAELSEPVGYMTEPSLNNLLSGNDVILGKENADRSRGEMHRKVSVYLAPQPSQDADYVKGLEDALNEIIINDDSAHYVCEKIAKKALANKPSQEYAK